MRTGHALELIDEASSDLGSRFFVRIREQMGLAYSWVQLRCRGWCRDSSPFISGRIRQKIHPVQTALLDEIGKLASDGLTNQELSRAKKKLIGQQQIANQSNDHLGYAAALDELYGLGFNHYKRLEREMEAVTLDDEKRVAAKYFLDQPYVLAVVQPPKQSRK